MGEYRVLGSGSPPWISAENNEVMCCFKGFLNRKRTL